MTATITTHELCSHIARVIAMTFEEQGGSGWRPFRSDDGCPIATDEFVTLGKEFSGVAWWRPEEDMIVVWAGNDADPEMWCPAEVPVRREQTGARWDDTHGAAIIATLAEHGIDA